MLEYIIQTILYISNISAMIWLLLFFIGLVYITVKIGWKAHDDEDYK